jgi:hypothetical protein
MKKFQVTSGAMVCSDPCYTTDVWCMEIVKNVKNGTWLAHSNIETVGDWGQRNIDLTVHHADHKIDESAWEEISGSFGVDSGQFGFFDSDGYRKADSVKGVPLYDFGGDFLTDDNDRDGDIWYRACCKITLDKPESWGVIPNGAVSSSGFGDGSYAVYGIKDTYSPTHEYIAFRVVFIEAEELDESDALDEWEENEN